jgi:hypothetical protein
LIGLIGLIRQERSDASFQLLTSNFQILIMIDSIDSIGGLIGLGDWHFAARSVIGFKRHFVPFNCFAALSIQAPSAFKDSRRQHLKASQQRLKAA